MEKVADQLGVEIAMPEISGGLPGSNVPINMLNSECRSAEPIVITPEGDAVPLEVREILPLTQNGIYTIKTTGREGKVHRSRILCHEGWKELYHKINYFYRDYFQDECGAFYRVIKKACSLTGLPLKVSVLGIQLPIFPAERENLGALPHGP